MRTFRTVLLVFMFVVLAHWAEHILQAVQVFVLGMPRKEALGALGFVFPRLVTSEWLHTAYAVVMFAGLALLLYGFRGADRMCWTCALGIQSWHLYEHLLLFVQATTGVFFFGRSIPTSVLQLIVPRVELHLIYNALVTVPMIVAVVLLRNRREVTV